MANIQWSSLFDLGGIVALVGVPYLIWGGRTKRKHFDFDFAGSSGLVSQNGKSYTWTFEGVIKNRSEVPNTITKIYLAVWKNYKRNSYLRFGHDNMVVEDANTGSILNLPLYFDPREAKKVTVKRTATVNQGDADARILTQRTEFPVGSGLFLPKFTYELVFEDVDKNYFDQHGVIRDINEANLWFTLGNSYRKLDDADFVPIVAHFIQIFIQKIQFFIRRLLWGIGLY